MILNSTITKSSNNVSKDSFARGKNPKIKFFGRNFTKIMTYYYKIIFHVIFDYKSNTSFAKASFVVENDDEIGILIAT